MTNIHYEASMQMNDVDIVYYRTANVSASFYHRLSPGYQTSLIFGVYVIYQCTASEALTVTSLWGHVIFFSQTD